MLGKGACGRLYLLARPGREAVSAAEPSCMFLESQRGRRVQCGLGPEEQQTRMDRQPGK